MSVFIIAEAGSSHDNDLQKAYRLIEAAKECGADAVKFQWTSDPHVMAKRRGLDLPAAQMYQQYLWKPVDEWLVKLKEHADKVGIEWMCTVYLKQDIATIAPLVKRFKVSAFEAGWVDFLNAHLEFGKQLIVSCNHEKDHWGEGQKNLLCVSEYPTTLDKVHLRNMALGPYDGFSDHTANVLTGAAAVATGARIIEAHIRLWDGDPNGPDYKHSLGCGEGDDLFEVTKRHTAKFGFKQYVQNIRTVEKML